MNIAFEGCFHGNLEEVYKTMQFIEEQQGIKIDALVSCGDFQAIRNKPDMYSMKCPEKYLEIGTFHEYYSGAKKAPYLTIFVGGNHEASNHSRELHFGGWVAPNIYYLGASNVIVLKKGSKSIRLGGISGIFGPLDFINSQLERFPFNKSSIVSSYHQKQIDVLKLSNLNKNSKIDVILSHDWPSAVVNYGDVDTLLRIKKHFEKDVRENNLGSSALNYILDSVRPAYWISGHLHVKYAALYPHSKDPLRNETANDKTMFLALDKCLPHRDFLQVVPFGRDQTWRLADEEEGQKSQNIELFYDQEWLILQKSTMEISNYRLSQDFYQLQRNKQK